MSLNYLDFEGITKNERGEFNGIDVLVAMARQGKIDPWAVDILCSFVSIKGSKS